MEAVAKDLDLDLDLVLVAMAVAKAPALVMAVVVAAMLRKPPINSSPVASKAAVTPKPEMAIALAMLAAAKTPLMQPRALANAVTAATSLASNPARAVGLVNLATLDSLDSLDRISLGRITLGSPVIPVPTSNLVDPAQLVRPSRGRNKS